MITESTIFIIGAGGSEPYGFPTGQDLRKNICTQYLNNFNKLIQDAFDSENIRDNELKIAQNFTRTFYNSNTKSIDLFLSRNPDFSNSGKRSIIIEILNSERKFIKKKIKFWENDWYAYLFNRMTETLIKKDDYKKFNENKVSFITFNYDRTLENYLLNSLTNSFLFAKEDVIEQVKSIPINHVYGQVGFLPWQGKEPIIYFGQDCRLDIIDSIQKNIKIIYDFEKGIDEEINNLIREAKKIFFLGFGYAEENLKILKIPEQLEKGQKVFGTALYFNEEEILRTKHRLNGKYVSNFHKDMIIEKCDCLTLLRKYL
ncbi:hypothetical protein BMS3Abin03_02273 [bacterium BMS3Abin03]|nr:hypothetical protein BMS3Abin03_02273 [bacterium BMS3Abin03]